MEEEVLPVEEVKEEPKEETKESPIKVVAAILVGLSVGAGGMYTLDPQDKLALEEANKDLETKVTELENTRFIKAERIVDQRGEPVFETHGEVVKVIINGQEYLPQ